MSTRPDRHRNHTADAAQPRGRPPASRRYSTAAIIAALAVVLAGVWAAAVIIPLTGQVDDLPRTSIPGEVTITVDAAESQIVYYEQQTWIATLPADPPLEVAVTGPDGQAVPVEPYEVPLQYRLPGLAGEAVASFDPDQPGDHTVTITPVDADALGDDDRVAIGPNLASSVLGGLVGPLVLVVLGLLAAAVIAARAAAYQR